MLYRNRSFCKSNEIYKIAISVFSVYVYGTNLRLRNSAHLLCLSKLPTNGKGKGKAIPLQSWTDPEGSRKLRLPDLTL